MISQWKECRRLSRTSGEIAFPKEIKSLVINSRPKAENLTAKERPRLKEVLQRHALLASVYLLKDFLKRLWQYKSPASVKKLLRYWCNLALETGARSLQTFVKTL